MGSDRAVHARAVQMPAASRVAIARDHERDLLRAAGWGGMAASPQ
jgi:hypothetical protein